MKFSMIFAFCAVVAACSLLPVSEAKAAAPGRPRRDTNNPFGFLDAGASMASGMMKTMGEGFNGLMKAGSTVAQAAQKQAADGMGEFATDMKKMMPGGNNDSASASAEAKTAAAATKQ